MMRIDKTSLWLPFVSGMLLSLTLPAFGVWHLVWVALVPFIIFASQKELSYKKLCLGTLLFGVPYAIVVTYPLMQVTSWWWTAGSESFGSTLLELQFAFIIFLVGFWGALFFLPVAYTARRVGHRPYGGMIIALMWIAIEWLRSSFALFGYSWGVLGYTLLDGRYLKHVAVLFGVYGLSLLVVVVNIAITELYRQLEGEETRWWKKFRALFVAPKKFVFVWFAVSIFIVMLGFGVTQERYVAAQSGTCDTPLRVAVIGSNIPTDDSVDVESYQQYRARISEALALGARIVVLPENVFPYFEINEGDGSLNGRNAVPLPEQNELYTDLLSLSRTYSDASIAAGLHTKIGRDRFNSLVVFERGTPNAYYHKRKLVPFAEYAPLSLNMSIIMSFARGEREQYFAIQGLRSTALMCSEVSDATIPLRGAQLIISPSNDSVFGSEAIKIVHERMARMRALEAEAFLFRATKGGISSIVGPSGVIIKENRGEEILVADICVQ